MGAPKKQKLYSMNNFHMKNSTKFIRYTYTCSQSYLAFDSAELATACATGVWAKGSAEHENG